MAPCGIITVIEASGNDALRTPMSMHNIGLRCGIMILLCSMGAVLPYLREVFGLLSSIFACMNNMFVPIVLWLA